MHHIIALLGLVGFSVSSASRIPLPSGLMSPLMLLLLGRRCPALHPRLLCSSRLLMHILLLTRTGTLGRVHWSGSWHCCSLRVRSRPARYAGHGVVIDASMHGTAALAVMKLRLRMSMLRVRRLGGMVVLLLLRLRLLMLLLLLLLRRRRRRRLWV